MGGVRMEKIFGILKDELEDKKGYITAEEIHHQPRLWADTLNIIEENKDRISSYIENKLSKENVRIIFTGAGTSAYVGDTVAPYIAKLLKKRVEAIATTDIVSRPEDYLEKDTPTILVSFARSGNSPESVATYNLAETLVDDLSQVVITCNKEGNLAISAEANEKNLLILMPDESNDKSFAMTSSFTCMMLTALMIFDMKNLSKNRDMVNVIINNGKKILDEESAEILKLVKLGYDRVVYLGDSALKGLSREAALKNLELTSGKVNTTCESVLGFRHGPKSIINDKTMVFMFVSGDEYTRKYDEDLLREMYNDKGEQKVIAIAYEGATELKAMAHKVFTVDENSKCKIPDAFAALNYILYAQVFAILYSLELGISPDNPRPDGTVNRVVQGVIIYDYK